MNGCVEPLNIRHKIDDDDVVVVNNNNDPTST